MKIDLNQIENNLQIIFESSIRLLTGADYSKLVIHKLVSAMEKSIIHKVDGSITAAHIYTIWVDPNMLTAWERKQDILDQLSSQLMKSADEAGVVFSYTPVIRLAGDNNLKNDQIEISATLSQEVVGQTSAIAIKNDDSFLKDKYPLIKAYLIRDGATIIPISENPFNIGRRPNNHLVLEDPRVSRSHAQIRSRLKKHTLFDLNSLGGTYVNGMRIYQHELKPGDVISFAGVSIIYSEEQTGDIQDTGGHTTTLDISQPTDDGEIK